MNNIPLMRETAAFYLVNSGGVLLERFDGTIAPVTLEAPASVTRNITDSEILLDSNNLAQWDYAYTKASSLYTKIEMWYKPIIPMRNKYAANKFCQRSGHPDGAPDNNLIGVDTDGYDGSYYQGLLTTAYGTMEEDRTLTINADGIRDDATADLLARMVIKWHSRILAQLTLTCSCSALDIELWDKIGVTATVIPTDLQSKTWIVTGHSIQPSVGTAPTVRLKLLEMGTAGLPSIETWADSLTTGDFKLNSLTTGDIIPEVL